MNINTTTYYNWEKQLPKDKRKSSPLRLTPYEKSSIINLKKYHPEYGCTRISGQLRLMGVYVSSTTVFNYLKLEGLITPLSNRKPPEREPKYLAFRKLQIIALDWSYIRVENMRYHLLAVIDTFSKYVLGYSIQKSVNSKHIRDLIALIYMDQKIENNNKLMLVMDQGTPNKALKTRIFLNELNITSKYAEVARPTNNAFIERWFRTIKNELTYSFGIEGFESYEKSIEIIGNYIEQYNKDRPHCSIYNFTPYQIHYEINNMSKAIIIYKQFVIQSRKSRLEYWLN